MLELHLTIFVSAIEGFNREVAGCRLTKSASDKVDKPLQVYLFTLE